jgi:hypothetical protein
MASTLPLTLLSTLRIGVGSASFLLPSFTCSALFYPVPATSLLAVRLFGCRDLALGVLLATAKSPEARRRAVLAGVAVDALDVVACVWGYGSGELDPVRLSSLILPFFTFRAFISIFCFGLLLGLEIGRGWSDSKCS